MINSTLENFRLHGSGFRNQWERDNCKTDEDIKYKIIGLFYDLLLRLPYTKENDTYYIPIERKPLFDNCGLDEKILLMSNIKVSFIKVDLDN